MKIAILYTVLVVVNLIGFAVGAAMLPPSVPIHFNAEGVADAVGSPWMYISMPAVSALFAIGVWLIFVSKSEKNRRVLSIVLVAIGAAFICMGWGFFAVAANAAEGQQTAFPFALVSVLPLSLAVAVIGSCLPQIKRNRWFGIRTRSTLKNEEVWRKTHRVGGVAFVVAGLVSAAAAIILSCIPGRWKLGFVALIVFVGCLLIASAIAVLYARGQSRKQKNETTEESE